MDFLANSIKGVVPFLSYFVAAALLLAAFLAIYGRITPYAEFVLIRQGNSAAAISLSGAMLGFALPLASAIAHSAAQGNGDVGRDRPDRAIAGLSGCAPRVAGPRATHTRRQSGSRNFSRRAVARRGGY